MVQASQKTILIIDDEAEIVQVLGDLLTSSGYRIITASNGVDGLKKLTHFTPHLIILDMNMPKMGGIHFFRRLVEDGGGKSKFPVLALTGRANLEDLFRDLEVDGFMTKPFQLDELLNEIERILAKHYGGPSPEEKEEKEQSKKILIVEDDETAFGKMAVSFVNSGYNVNVAKSAHEGLERAIADCPDLIMVKLGLPDLPGDIVASKLRTTSKTSHIPLILYTTPKNGEDLSVTEQICDRAGVKSFIESNEPNVLLSQVNFLLHR